MSEEPKLFDSLMKLIGTLIGFCAAAVVTTWIGLYILNYLGWLPF